MNTFYKRLLIIGIAVGVFCSLVVFTAGQRQWTAIQLRDKILNSNTYKIVKMPNSSSLYSMGLDYVKEIQSLLPENLIAAPIAKGFNISIAFEGEPIGGVVTGTGSYFQKLTDLQLIQGRYLSDNDIETYQKVCVLKSNIYDLVRTR
ncbi:MAG: hypothetical protein K0R09_3899, partial [Clostridiales bacterium]|nr:hypothetical protein [Clostridiales bacterium]